MAKKIPLTGIKVPYDTIKLAYKGKIVKTDFDCASTNITSLVGAPSEVHGDFHCGNTNITSLEGAPEYVGGWFNCCATKITSLHNIHKQIKFIGDDFYLCSTIKSNIIGIMLIKGIKMIEFVNSDDNIEQKMVETIINKHLRGDRNVHDCQEELLEAGLRNYARL